MYIYLFTVALPSFFYNRVFFSPLCAPHRKLPLKEENGKESLKPDTIEIKVHSDNSIHTKPDDSKA